jgi:hypothetical protein
MYYCYLKISPNIFICKVTDEYANNIDLTDYHVGSKKKLSRWLCLELRRRLLQRLGFSPLDVDI